MPRTKKSKAKGGKRRPSVNPSEDVIVYRGPLKLPQGLQERQKMTTVLHFGPIVMASAAGLVNFVIADDPSGFVDWGNLAALWDEFRVLGFTFNYEPFDRYNQSTTITVGPIFTVIDRDDATLLTTEAQCLEYESLKVFNMADPFKREIRSMTSVEDATFITTASPVGRTWFKAVGSGVATTTNFGKYWIDILVQFRGRN